MRALSALVAAHRASLEESLAAAGELDAVIARAALGAAWGARVPAVGEQGVVRLDGATHPLLASAAATGASAPAGGVSAVVGNRLELGGEGCPQEPTGAAYKRTTPAPRRTSSDSRERDRPQRQSEVSASSFDPRAAGMSVTRPRRVRRA